MRATVFFKQRTVCIMKYGAVWKSCHILSLGYYPAVRTGSFFFFFFCRGYLPQTSAR